MKLHALAVILVLLVVSALAQQAPTASGVLDAAATKALLPAGFFFDGQVAPAQARNANAIRFADGKYVIACLVDNSGYSSSVASKFQGILIAEDPITINGTALPAGVYGFGVSGGDQFNVLNVGASPVFSVKVSSDLTIKHPVPLKITESGGGYHLYLGPRYVTISK